MNLIIIPWSLVAINTASWAATLTTKEIRDISTINILFYRWHEPGSNNLDFSACLLIKESLYNGPNSAEKHWCVNNEHITHDLWVIVGTDLSSKLTESISLGVGCADTATSHIHNSQTLKDFFSLGC